MDCPKCGTWNPEDKRVCWRCQTEMPKPVEKKKKQRVMFLGLPLWSWVVVDPHAPQCFCRPVSRPTVVRGPIIDGSAPFLGGLRPRAAAQSAGLDLLQAPPLMSSSTPPSPHELGSALLTWIGAGRRDLPWRRRRDPYAVWISEMMLQQTQVATVVPYFERWLAQFPDVNALAAAPLDAVLKAWEGLGYYARARNLHRAAQIVAAQHGGQLPGDRAALLALPGIGAYTAGAILSLAFGRPEPVLDGNVRRVLCRVHDIDEDPRRPAVQRRLWGLAAELVQAAPPGLAGDLNEALMELGALVCTPGLPNCAVCPLQTACLAHVRGVEAARPVMAARPRTPHYDVTAAVIQDAAGRYLIVRRPPVGLLGGLWGFPGSVAGDCASNERVPPPDAVGGAPDPGTRVLADCLARALAASLGIAVAVGEPLGEIKHAYTHFRITLHPFRCRLVAGEPQALGYSAAQWATAAELMGYAFPVTDRKIADGLARSPDSD